MANPFGYQGVPVYLESLEGRVLDVSLKHLLAAILHEQVVEPPLDAPEIEVAPLVSLLLNLLVLVLHPDAN